MLNPRPECDEADLMEFPADETLVVATVRSDSRAQLLAGKDWGERFDNIHSFFRSPDGKNYAYVAVVGNRALVVKDRERVTGKYNAVGCPILSPDGKNLAYVVHMGGELNVSKVIAGTAESEEFDSVQLHTFTPDGKKVVFGARKGQELWWKVMEVK